VVSTWVMSGMKYNLASLTGPLTDLFTNGIGQTVRASALDGTAKERAQEIIMPGRPAGRR